MSRTKKQRKIVIGFGQGAFVIPVISTGDQRKLQEDIGERVQLANDCVRMRDNDAREARRERRKRRGRR